MSSRAIFHGAVPALASCLHCSSFSCERFSVEDFSQESGEGERLWFLVAAAGGMLSELSLSPNELFLEPSTELLRTLSALMRGLCRGRAPIVPGSCVILCRGLCRGSAYLCRGSSVGCAGVCAEVCAGVLSIGKTPQHIHVDAIRRRHAIFLCPPAIDEHDSAFQQSDKVAIPIFRRRP